MNRSIRSYEDLLEEQKRLQLLLKEQKDQIRLDLQEIKEEFKPVMSLVSIVGKFTTRETRNEALVTAGSSLTIDWLAKKFLSHNLLLRMFLPPVLKNVSSHVLFDNLKPLLNRIFRRREKNTLATPE